MIGIGHRGMLGLLADNWPAVSERLSADTVEYLLELIGRLDQAAPGDAADLTEEIRKVLRRVLPDESGPVRDAVYASGTRGPAGQDLRDQAAALAARSQRTDLVTGVSASPSPAEVAFWTERWLLAQDALSEDELLLSGHRPDDPELIRLDRDDGGAQWPAFQFGPDGTAYDAVRVVNRLLGAEEDPWGAADWWLGHNKWLDEVPARLLGEADDDVLAEAARAVDPGM